MKLRRVLLRASAVTGLVTAGWLVACERGPSPSSGNATLGIASIQVSETASRLLIVGLDDKKAEVAKVEVVRGPFTMSESWAEGREGAARNVDGRRINMRLGDTKNYYEGEG